jgi:23S rRNA (adenine2503-C2)-methyltransferase
MLKEITKRAFTNGVVYLLKTEDDFPLEVTDTFLPFYTKDAIGRKQNQLTSCDLGDRKERWMVGVSTMSGCPVRCKFCATAKLKKWRNLTTEEIVNQLNFILAKNPQYFFIKLSPINKNDISDENGLGGGVIEAKNIR